MSCNNCGSLDIDRDTARGNAVCTQCGAVVEDQIIVSEVQFLESSSGPSTIAGCFVSSEGRNNSIVGFDDGKRESRLFTLQKGKNRIQKLASQMEMTLHCADMAYNYFKLAVNKGLTRGRKCQLVAASCLYIVCRTEKKPLLLLDFSDQLQEDVFALGHTYQQLAKELYISIPTIDPCLYIERFSRHLEFGEKTLEVCRTATRLVSRMSRDWMTLGRRPSGICGAALLVASRIFGFNRTIDDVMKVVRISKSTLKKRLCEFEKTPSSQLTIDEFHSIFLEETSDPPSFTESKRKAKLQELEESGELCKLLLEAEKLKEELDEAIQSLINSNSKKYKKFNKLNQQADESRNYSVVAPSPADLDDEIKFYTNLLTDIKDPDYKNTNAQLEVELLCGALDKEEILLNEKTLNVLGELGLFDCLKEEKNGKKDEVVEDSGELDLTGVEDSELDALLLTEEEVRIRTTLWMRENAQYLRDCMIKEERKAREALENKHQIKKRRRTRRKKNMEVSSSAHEAIEKIIHERKLSNKINYDVLVGLNINAQLPNKSNTAQLPSKTLDVTQLTNITEQFNSSDKNIVDSRISANSLYQIADQSLMDPEEEDFYFDNDVSEDIGGEQLESNQMDEDCDSDI